MAKKKQTVISPFGDYKEKNTIANKIFRIVQRIQREFIGEEDRRIIFKTVLEKLNNIKEDQRKKLLSGKGWTFIKEMVDTEVDTQENLEKRCMYLTPEASYQHPRPYKLNLEDGTDRWLSMFPKFNSLNFLSYQNKNALHS